MCIRDSYIIDDVCYAGEKTQNIKVKEAKVLRGGMLLLTFSTEEQRLFDTTLLKGSAFEPLKDEKAVSYTHLLMQRPIIPQSSKVPPAVIWESVLQNMPVST